MPSITRLNAIVKALVVPMMVALSMGVAQPIALGEGLTDEKIVSYGCSGEFDYREITALFFDSSPAEVVLRWHLSDADQGGIRLLRQRSATGVLYTDGTYSFWVKGRSAIYQLVMAKGAVPYKCTVLKKGS